MRINTLEVGRLATRVLLDKMADKPVPLLQTVPASLVIRRTSGPWSDRSAESGRCRTEE